MRTTILARLYYMKRKYDRVMMSKTLITLPVPDLTYNDLLVSAVWGRRSVTFIMHMHMHINVNVQSIIYGFKRVSCH